MEVANGSWVRTEEGRVEPSGPVLALDTSTDRACLAIVGPDGAVHIAEPGESRRHGRSLVPAIRDLLRSAGVRPGDLSAIGVGLGPGSFTGLRIGLTAAKTLAYVVGCPLVGLDSFEAIARNAPAESLRVTVVGDGQRGGLFVSEFGRDVAGGPLIGVGPIRVESLADWPGTVVAGTIVVGPPLGRLEPVWPVGVVRGDPGTAYPEGRRLAAYALDRLEASHVVDPWFVEPDYGRRGAAEEKAAVGQSSP